MSRLALGSLVALLLVSVVHSVVHAQQRSPLAPDNFGIVYDVPATERVQVAKGVEPSAFALRRASAR